MELTPQQWEDVKALFETALEKTPAERASYLEDISTDSVVREEVARLLANHSKAGKFLSAGPVPGLLSAPPAPTQSFSAGDLLAGRFHITRFLACGGMGEVYEAEDVELHEHVALKTIRTELLRDPRALERFKREVHLAKKVTHPNVCRIFEFFRHPLPRAGNGGDESLLFVTMELLAGETLSLRLQRESRLLAKDALPIALQIAAGLGAAHEAGVLHRDFKPGNVVLISGAKGMRAVITDFGLALRSGSDSSGSGPVTHTGELLGTPAYMSPEQVEGRDLTPASDVYSLGLVLYEMLAGTRPFNDTTPLSMAVRRLREDPPPLRNSIPEVDRRWERVIMHCLERDPKFRFQNATEVAQALRGEIEVPAFLMRRLWRPIAAVLALVLAITAGILLAPRIRLWLRPGIPGTATLNPGLKSRPSVAVLPLRNLSGRTDTEWVSTALPDMLSAEIAAGEKVRTVPGENIARATADLGLKARETLAKDTLAHLREYLGSDFVVLGSYLAEERTGAQGQIRVDLWLQEASSGDIVATVSEKGPEEQLSDLATRAGADLRAKLGVGEITPKEAASARASLLSNPEALRFYSEGLAKLRVFDVQGARDLLEIAAQSDPKSALVHSALADAWSAQGYDEHAKEESEKALDLSAGLSREEHLWIEGRNWELNRNWEKAVEIYRTLFNFFPDNIDYGLRLAAAEKQARTVDEALSTLAALRQLPPPAGDDPRIELQQADVYDVKGAYQDQEAAAVSAANRARAIGAKLLLARALSQQARAFEKQGKPNEALAKAQEAAQISTTVGERAEMAKALTIIGIVRFDQGNFAEAAKVYNQALVIQREIGDKRGAATSLNDIANALGSQGDLAGSIEMFEEALARFREVGDKHSAAAVLGSMAARTVQMGDLQRAKKMLEEGLVASTEIGDQERSSTAVYNIGEVLRYQGDLKGAWKMHEQALSLSKKLGDESGVAYATVSLADVLTAQGNLDGARRKYNEGLAIRNRIGEKGTAAETQVSLASLSIEEGHAAEVEAAIREARAEFRKEGSSDDEILSDMVLAKALLAQGKLTDAQKEIQTSRDLLVKGQDFSVQLQASIVTAQVQAASGQFDEAARILKQTIARAGKSGYLGFRLEARLALGESEIASGKSSAGRATLASLKQEAKALGYGLIVSKADKLLAQSGRRPS